MKTSHIISHTHWDREWYQNFEEFRYRLVNLLDRLLTVFEESPDYVFHLDAQTICLEDYLEIRPGCRELLEKYIASGNLLVGPWYVQNDFFLTSGESTVRNLLIGTELAEEFGRCEYVGYAPDQFGLISQLPQIFNGFGITSCIFGRGRQLFTRNENGELEKQPQMNEFYWTSPDGSEVLASYLSRWYNNAQRFSSDPERAFMFFSQAVQDLDNDSLTSQRLLMNGVDHLEAQEDLLQVAAALNDKLPEGETVKQSTLREYIEDVRQEVEASGLKLENLSGEMRHGVSNNLLQGTLSAWTPLKRENVIAQSRLELLLEPFYAILALHSGNNALYDQDKFRYLWKSLIKNHPHDSICGCSCDRVHEDNMNRFARIGDLSKRMLKGAFGELFARLDRSDMDKSEYLLAVFNPSPSVLSAVVPAKLYLPLDEDISAIQICDPEGREVAFTVEKVRKRFLAVFPAINLPGKTPCHEVDILLETEKLPSLGYRIYRVKPHAGTALSVIPHKSLTGDNVLENDKLKVTVNPAGRVAISDKANGAEYSDCVSFIDEADIGHSYNFFPAPDGKVIDISAQAEIKVERLMQSAIRDTVKVSYRCRLPVEYNFEKRCPSSETADFLLTAVYSLDRFSNRLDIQVTVDNASFEHRIRAVFRPGIVTDDSLASVPFGFISRSCRESHNGIRHSGNQPNSGIVSVNDGNHCFTVYNEGLFEYEHLVSGEITLTLLRSVRRITNSDYPDQEDFVAEAYEWEAQAGGLPGTHSFRIALRPGPATPAELETEFRSFLSPPCCGFESADEKKFSSGRPCDQDTTLRELFFRILPTEEKFFEPEYSCITIAGSVVLSALKKAESGQGAVLRVYNPSAELESDAVLMLPSAVSRVMKARLDESVTGEILELNDGNVSIHLKPGEIVSLLLY